MIVWIFLVQPYAQDRSLTLLVRLTSLALPLFSLSWVAVAARLCFAIRDFARPTAFYLLLVRILLHPLGDAVYVYLVLNDAYNSTGVPGPFSPSFRKNQSWGAMERKGFEAAKPEQRAEPPNEEGLSRFE
jgi:hypothetical protein